MNYLIDGEEINLCPWCGKEQEFMLLDVCDTCAQAVVDELSQVRDSFTDSKYDKRLFNTIAESWLEE